jgi:hypothetical protein
MQDDEIIETYERELDALIEAPRRGNRGFWLVAVALLLGCVLLVVEIFANRPLVGSIGHAESDLRAAQAIALRVHASTSSFLGADATGLSAADSSRTYTSAEEPSLGLGRLSIFASDSQWAAAVQVRPDACMYIFEQIGSPTRYGGGTDCTGRSALGASSDAW